MFVVSPEFLSDRIGHPLYGNVPCGNRLQLQFGLFLASTVAPSTSIVQVVRCLNREFPPTKCTLVTCHTAGFSQHAPNRRWPELIRRKIKGCLFDEGRIRTFTNCLGCHGFKSFSRTVLDLMSRRDSNTSSKAVPVCRSSATPGGKKYGGSMEGGTLSISPPVRVPPLAGWRVREYLGHF